MQQSPMHGNCLRDESRNTCIWIEKMLYRDGWGRMKAVQLRQEYDKLLAKLKPASIPLHFKEEIETMIIK